MKDAPELVRRLAAVEASERHFSGKSWRPGSVDCGQLTMFHLKRFGWKLPKIQRYRTIEQGRQQLLAHGAETMAEIIDLVGLRRIAPAEALLGDLYFMPGDGPLGAVTLAIGNGAMKGFHEDHAGLVSMRSQMIVAAWRVVRDR